MFIKINIPSNLVVDPLKVVPPKYLIMEDFDLFSSSAFNRAFNEIVNNPMPVAPVQVDSPGGVIYALMGILSTMEASEKPVLTFCNSLAMSCGLIMLAAGTKGYRYMSEHASLMLHEASGSLEGKTSEVKAELMELDRLNETVIELLAKYSKKNKAFYQNLIKKNLNNDFYITAKDALDWGIVDFIGSPTIEMDVRADYKISVKKSYIECQNGPKRDKKTMVKKKSVAPEKVK